MRKPCLPPRSSFFSVLAVLASLLFAKVEAQQPCPTTNLGNRTFTTQADINAFGAMYGHCSDITLGDALIGNASGGTLSDITDLSPLANVKTITGYLRIRNNPNLTSLKGFAALTSIGTGLAISLNSNLEEINGFPALTSIGTSLIVTFNSNLEEINGFSALTSIGSFLRIEHNPVLTDISGLLNINPNSITTTGASGLEIQNNPQLEVCHLSNICSYLSGSGAKTISGNKTTCSSVNAITTACASGCAVGSKTFTTQAQINAFANDYASCNNIAIHNLIIGYETGGDNSDITDLTPLANIKTLTGDLIIRRNINLTTLNGLQNITSFKGDLRLDSNHLLADISALSGITQAGYLNIRNNNVLQNLDGLHNLTQISDYLYIRTNAMLTNLSPLQNLTSVGNYIKIEDNAVLTSIIGLRNIVASSFSELTIKNNPELAVCNMPNFCTYLSGSGNRDISGNKTFCMSVPAITATCSCTTGADFTLSTQAEVNDFGLVFAHCTDVSVNNLIIGYNEGGDNSDITDLSPLANVKTLTGNLIIRRNINLTTLNGLHNITSFDGDLRLDNNHLLTDISALSNITRANYLNIRNNNVLLNLDGLHNLTQLSDYLYIRTNAMLTDINALQNLASVGSFIEIYENPVLTNIIGLRNIAPSSITGTTGLRIVNNPELAVCNLSNFCTYLSGSGARTISGNKTNCLDEQAVTTACASACASVSGQHFTFNTQAQLDEFGALYGNCPDIILRNVVIGSYNGQASSDITDLSPLANVKTIIGDLWIRSNPNLLSLDGVDGFPGLTSIGNTLNIWDNTGLQQINGFLALTGIRGPVLFQSNAKLEEINGFPVLASIGEFFAIQNNAKLKNINGFSAFTSIGWFLRILNNSVLTDISGLQNINLATTTGAIGLDIRNNPQLAVCNLSNFCTYLSGPGGRTISGNKTTCETEQAVLEACFPCPTVSLGDKIFETQAELDLFGAMYGHCPDIILGDVVIGYESGYSLSDIHDLSPLANIKTITGYLVIRNNPNLHSLDGLKGFPALTSIGKNLSIRSNANLENTNGFLALENIGWHLDFQVNTKLENINGFSALTSIGGYLDFYNNAIENINGFPALTSIGGYLYIEFNASLTDISGLQHINPATIMRTNGLRITNNPQLEVCNLPNFCMYLSGTGARTISGNKTTCLNVQAVMDVCAYGNFLPDANNTLYVNQNSLNSGGNGKDWNSAVKELADALKYAQLKYNADPAVFDATPLKIYVAQGTYKPLYRADNLDESNPQDRDNAFVMVKNVQIYGGFSGTESAPEERNYQAHPTILSGDIDALSGLSGDDAYHVIISAGDVGSALLDGFTVSGGYITSADSRSITVNSTPVGYERGSGLSASNSSPRIRNVVFTGNQAYAGVVSHTTSNATFVNTLFTGNTATYGTVYNASSSPVFVNCTFSGNTGTTTANDGVAMRNVTSHPEFYNSIVWGNHTANGNVNNIFNSGGGSPTSIPVYQHSLVQSITSNAGGNLSGDTDPLFKDAANGDYRPQAGSPVINAGSNTYFEGLATGSRDLAGNPRLLRHYIDLGAYESDCGGATLVSNAEISRPLTTGENYLYSSCSLLAVVKPENATGSIVVSAVSAGNLVSHNNARYVRRYFQLSAENAGTTDVTLFFTQADFDHYNSTFGEDNGATLPDNLRIARYPDGYTLDGTALTSSDEATYIEPSVAPQWNETLGLWEVTFTTPGFSGFFITGQSDGALPVTLADFTARVAEQSVLLTWQTASEVNFSHFEAERSRDGKHWQKLGTIPAGGGNERGMEYHYRDQSPLAGLSYYRLRMVDRAVGHRSGSYEYSDIRSVSISKDPRMVLSVYPNPGTARIYFDTKADILEVLLWDIAGRLVRKAPYKEGVGVSVAGLASGVLLVEARMADGTSRTGRVVVQP